MRQSGNSRILRTECLMPDASSYQVPTPRTPGDWPRLEQAALRISGPLWGSLVGIGQYHVGILTFD